MDDMTGAGPRVLSRVPPSDEVLVAMADIDGMHGKLTDILVAIGRLEERLAQQDGKWPDLLTTIHHLDLRVDQIERIVHDAQAQTRVFRWAFGAAITMLGMIAAYLAIYG